MPATPISSSSEKNNPDQLPHFNEAEFTTDSTAEEPTVETVTYERKKQRGHRDPKPEN